MHSIAGEWVEVPADIAALPNLMGYGNVYDLHQAMARDASGALKGLVEQFAATTDVAGRRRWRTASRGCRIAAGKTAPRQMDRRLLQTM